MNTRLPLLTIVYFSLFNHCFGQELVIKKGIIVDSLEVQEVPAETFSLYLPESFEKKGTWPLLVVVDEEGKGKEVLTKFTEANERQDYILAASNSIHDSLSLTENVKRLDRLFTSLNALFPLNKNRLFVAGFDAGGRLASVLPIFFKNLGGVITCGATLNNFELINSNNPFHFIGVVGREDFTYNEILVTEKFFNRLKFDNNILLFDGGKEWPQKNQLSKALSYLTLRSMAKGYAIKDSTFIQDAYSTVINGAQLLKMNNQLVLAHREFKEIQNAFRDLRNIDTVKKAIKDLENNKLFRMQKRRQDEAFFKESFLREDYQYALEEDVRTFNYNNLGWWNYQMTKMNQFVEGNNLEEQLMGKRLIGYVNALIEDSIDFNQTQTKEDKDDEALLFLNMLKTITEPEAFDFYLNVISLSAKYEDFGTAIFYLEEVLKKGFTDKNKLYSLPNTALLRITPEFNEVVKKYFEASRYNLKD